MIKHCYLLLSTWKFPPALLLSVYTGKMSQYLDDKYYMLCIIILCFHVSSNEQKVEQSGPRGKKVSLCSYHPSRCIHCFFLKPLHYNYNNNNNKAVTPNCLRSAAWIFYRYPSTNSTKSAKLDLDHREQSHLIRESRKSIQEKLKIECNQSA